MLKQADPFHRWSQFEADLASVHVRWFRDQWGKVEGESEMERIAASRTSGLERLCEEEFRDARWIDHMVRLRRCHGQGAQPKVGFLEPWL